LEIGSLNPATGYTAEAVVRSQDAGLYTVGAKVMGDIPAMPKPQQRSIDRAFRIRTARARRVPKQLGRAVEHALQVRAQSKAIANVFCQAGRRHDGRQRLPIILALLKPRWLWPTAARQHHLWRVAIKI
jgi:hypothetical protein